MQNRNYKFDCTFLQTLPIAITNQQPQQFCNQGEDDLDSITRILEFTEKPLKFANQLALSSNNPKTTESRLISSHVTIHDQVRENIDYSPTPVGHRDTQDGAGEGLSVLRIPIVRSLLSIRECTSS